MTSTQSTRPRWTCRNCGFPVSSTPQGVIYIDMAEVRAAEDYFDSLDGTVPLADLFDPDQPDPTWKTAHIACLPDDAHLYCVPLEEADTPVKLLEWTAHLMGKTWISVTNWDAHIRAAAQEVAR